MQLDALAVRLRPRTPIEAADLGMRLCQSAARSRVPLLSRWSRFRSSCSALCAVRDRRWLPALAIWWLKPWLDRTILFVLSRAAFGQQTTWRTLGVAAAGVVGQLLLTLTLQRLSFWRSLTQPVYQLEGGRLLGGAAARAQAAARRRRRRRS